jgi:PA14 domain
LESSVFNDGSRLFSFGRQEVSIMRSPLRTFFPGLVCSLFILSSVAAVNASLGGGGFGAFFGASTADSQAPSALATLGHDFPTTGMTEAMNELEASGVNHANPRNDITIPSANMASQSGCINSVPISRWKGEYYKLQTQLVMVLDHGEGNGISGNWSTGAPSLTCGGPGGTGGDNFKVRYTRTVNFTAGSYRFAVNGDPGDRFSLTVSGTGGGGISGFLGAVPHTIDLTLTAGNHTVTLEYYESTGLAFVNLTWVAGCLVDVPADRWRGELFNNTTLTGAPTAVRDYGNGFLNLGWALGSPNSPCGMGADNFSARWTRTVNFGRGIYRFTVTVDDGARLYVDGQLIINAWFDQGATTYTADMFLNAGNHEVKLEYYEHTFDTVIQLSWAAVCLSNVPADRWRGEYFNNTTLAGSPAMTLDDGDGFLNLNFGGGSPGSGCGLGADNFSARWTRTVNFAAGVYRFTASVDNGVRLYVDGQLKIDQWAELPPNTYTADVNLTAGAHVVKLEFVEFTGGAAVSLSWADFSNCLANVPAGRWRGEYYNNITLTGPVAMARDDGGGFLNIDFGLGGPGGPCGLGVDNFSARWTRTDNFAASTYRFSVTGDDGVRLYVDGQLKIDKWFSQGATTYTADVTLSAGNHEVKLEYFESGGPGIALLSWADATGVNCLPNVPLPLISNVSQTGGRENIASTAPATAPKRCGKKSSD